MKIETLPFCSKSFIMILNGNRQYHFKRTNGYWEPVNKSILIYEHGHDTFENICEKLKKKLIRHLVKDAKENIEYYTNLLKDLEGESQ